MGFRGKDAGELRSFVNLFGRGLWFSSLVWKAGGRDIWIRLAEEEEDCFEEKRRGEIGDWLINVQGYLYNIPPSLENLARKEKETWDEATGRAAFSKALITDQMPGMLDQMMERAYPGQNAGKSPEFGEEILEIARRLDEGVV